MPAIVADVPVQGRWVAGVVILAGLVGAMWLGLLTRDGLFVGPDGTAYLGGAQNVAHGKGVTLPFVPVTAEVNPVRAASWAGAAPLYHYSPLLPFTLGVAVRAGISATTAARALNVLACGICTALLAWAVLRATLGSIVATGGAVLLFVTTGLLTLTLGSVASEALFVPLCLVALGVLAVWIAAPRWWWATTFVVVAGTSTLARTVGAAVIATGALAVLCWYPAALRARLLRAIGVVLAGLGPSWLGAGTTHRASASSRTTHLPFSRHATRSPAGSTARRSRPGTPEAKRSSSWPSWPSP